MTDLLARTVETPTPPATKPHPLAIQQRQRHRTVALRNLGQRRIEAGLIVLIVAVLFGFLGLLDVDPPTPMRRAEQIATPTTVMPAPPFTAGTGTDGTIPPGVVQARGDASPVSPRVTVPPPVSAPAPRAGGDLAQPETIGESQAPGVGPVSPRVPDVPTSSSSVPEPAVPPSTVPPAPPETTTTTVEPVPQTTTPEETTP